MMKSKEGKIPREAPIIAPMLGMDKAITRF